MKNLDVLRVYNFDRKFRLGEKSDGGYVCAELNEEYDCYISAGISNEESFSRDFINKFDMGKHNCYAFDGTIEDYPYNACGFLLLHRHIGFGLFLFLLFY